MRRPNIILLLIDDLGWRDLSCYGSTFYDTPNLDRLAACGVRFVDAYAAAPVCSPTRASLMTGKYPARVGVTNYIGRAARGRLIDAPYIDHLPLEEISLARALGEGGYATWHVGKWHLGRSPFYPEHHGFDVNVGGCNLGHPHKGYFSPWHIEALEDGPTGEYLTDRLTDEAIRLIKSSSGRPFFLNMWHYAVHTPIQAIPEHLEAYRQKAQDLGLDGVEDIVAGEYFPSEHKRHLRVQRRQLQSDPKYAAMIKNLDDNIGRLLKAVDDMGEADNTIVIFTSDNGGLATAEGSPTCNAPLAEGKGWMCEGGVRVPLIVKWPGRTQPGRICDVPVTSPDLYPTVLEMAGLALRPEQHVDGVSLAQLLCGATELEREAIFWHYPHYGNQGGTPGSSVRMGDHKLVEFFEDCHVELYNLREDIGERRNLAATDPDRVSQMQGMLAAWREGIGARIPEANPHYQSRPASNS